MRSRKRQVIYLFIYYYYYYLLQLGFHPVAVASTFVYTAKWSTHKTMEYTETREL
jgi:hypothetical protein